TAGIRDSGCPSASRNARAAAAARHAMELIAPVQFRWQMSRDPLPVIADHTIWARMLSAAPVLGALTFEPAAGQCTLERVVLISRHGVRAPTDSDKLNDYTKSRTWPRWPVQDACLTPHGRLLASRMGSFYRRELTARGLFPANRRPTAKEVYVFA